MLSPSSSAAEVFPLRTFAATSKSWLKAALAHPLLTPADKTFGATLYVYFNVKHYKQTGELLAWPSWDTLTTRSGLSRATIAEATYRFEQFQLLDVERGRYDRASQRRDGNHYRARFPRADQGPNCGPNQGPPNELYLGDSPSPLGDSLDSVSQRAVRGGEDAPEGQEEGKFTQSERRALARLKRLAARKGGSR